MDPFMKTNREQVQCIQVGTWCKYMTVAYNFFGFSLMSKALQQYINLQPNIYRFVLYSSSVFSLPK